MLITSKGLDLYGYVEDTSQPLIFKLKEPEGAIESYPVSSPNTTYNQHLEVNSGLPLHTIGSYSFEAGSIKRSCKINSVTGNISDSNMNDMLENQQCEYTKDGIISYGFYDANSGYNNIQYTRHHQNYVYYGDTKRADWMQNLVDNHCLMGEQAFSSFVLPGAHDAGMNTSSNISKVAKNAKEIVGVVDLIAAWIASLFNTKLAYVLAIIGVWLSSKIEQLMINLAITQKDTITDMLNMGIRYFDFRPGYMAKIDGIPITDDDGIYHQHNFLPGMSFTDFLDEIVEWLDKHTGEIVVIELNHAGFYNDDMIPSVQKINKEINKAISNSELIHGDIRDSKKTYNELIDSKKRLLFFNTGFDFDQATKYDSYDDTYETLVPSPILLALEQMTYTPKNNEEYTVLQFQGTASGALCGLDYIELFDSDNNASSPLLMTKAYFDSNTYPWAKENLQKFNKDYPLVILNDFVDPIMSQIAEESTLKRIKIGLNTINITKCDNECYILAVNGVTNVSYQLCHIKSGFNNLLDVTIVIKPGDYSQPETINNIPAKAMPIQKIVKIPSGTYNLIIFGVNWGGGDQIQYSLNGETPIGTEYKPDGSIGVFWTNNNDPASITVE